MSTSDEDEMDIRIALRKSVSALATAQDDLVNTEQALETARDERDAAEAEIAKLREALEMMVHVFDKGSLHHQPHALFQARAALGKQ